MLILFPLFLMFALADGESRGGRGDGARSADGGEGRGGGVVNIDWTVEPAEQTAATTSRLVSFNLDWHPANEGLGWGANASIISIPLSHPRLRALAAHMAPAVLRIGGSEGDDAVYNFSGACTRSRGGSGVPDPAYCLEISRWDEILDFGGATGVDVVFGLNVMYGRNCTVRCSPQPCGAGVVPPCSEWDPSNAIELMEYTAKQGKRIYGFEVGNEKEHVLSPDDYANCLKKMRETLDKLWPDADNRPLLIGPDENPRGDWLHAMLGRGGDVVDVVTYHLYPGYGLNPDLAAELLEPGFLDFTRVIAGVVQRTVQRAAPNAELWVGETAASWHSGRAGVTDAFLSGFWFIDQLGTLASMSHAVMCRQCLVGGNYSLLGVNDGYVPKPDYWTGLLFKRLMGETVLASYQSEPAVKPYIPKIRGYVHCTPSSSSSSSSLSSSSSSSPLYPPGAVTFAFLNLDEATSFDLDITGIDLDGTRMDVSEREEYVMTTPDGDLSSSRIMLNGKVLELATDGSLPSLTGRSVQGGVFRAPPLSYGFVVFPQAGAPACL